MDLEPIIKVAASLLTLVGSSGALLWKARSKRRQRERELDVVIDHGLRDFADEKDVTRFLIDCKRERLFESIIGVPVVQGEVAPLADFRRDGLVRLSLIRDAWSYREIKDGHLSFDLSIGSQIFFWGGVVFFALCGLVAVAAALALQVPGPREAKISYVVIAALMVLMMPFPVVMTRAEQAVRVIRSKKKKNA